jgi:hypothetical protein
MITNMVFALDITAIGVLAANSAVMTASGAPAELPRTESAGNLRASPGKIRNRENKEKKSEAAMTREAENLLLPYFNTKKSTALQVH